MRQDSPDPIPLLHSQTLPTKPSLMEEAGLCIGKSEQGKGPPLKGEVKVNTAAEILPGNQQ